MIGLVSSVLAAVMVREPAFLLVVPAYILRMKSRNWALVAFYIYAVLLVVRLPNESIYEFAGLKVTVVAGVTLFLVLDEILRGVRLDTGRIPISVLLVGSAFNDYAFLGVLVGVAFYTAYRSFGRVSTYLAVWTAISALFLYLTWDRLADPGAQALAVIGLGLIFLLLAERKEVEFLDVSLFEED